MAKRTLLVLLSVGLINANQSETKAPAFEVAAIKPSTDASRVNGCFMKAQPGGQTLLGRCIQARVMMTYAYKIIDSQVVGAPDWMNSELYDFDAKADHALTRPELAPIIQTFLADRFKLQFHRETRTLPSLALSVDKSGSKLVKNESTYEFEIPIQSFPGDTMMPRFKGVRCPMSYLSWWLGQRAGRPAIDKTGLDGFWDFTLEFVPDAMNDRRGPDGAPMPPIEGPNLQTAVRDQLGLKMESVKGPVEVYVIDHVEKPTAN